VGVEKYFVKSSDFAANKEYLPYTRNYFGVEGLVISMKLANTWVFQVDTTAPFLGWQSLIT
jgi:hypothetical protein